MSFILPTLTLDGWLKHPPVMLDKIFDYFSIVDSDSSVAYFGEVYSLDYIIHKHSNDMDGLKDEITTSLSKILSRYWDDYEVDVFVNKTDVETIYKISIDLTAIVNGIPYNLSKYYLSNNIVDKVDLDYLITGEIG